VTLKVKVGTTLASTTCCGENMPHKTIITILLTLLIPIPAFAQEYVVKFERPAKVGEKYSLSASGGMSIKSTVVEDQQVVESETVGYQVQFAAIVEVLEVDAKGREVKHAFTVEKFTKIEGSGLTELVPPGSVIIADSNRETPYSLQDGLLSEQAQEALDVVIGVVEPGDPSDDEFFGTTETKQVGESWAVNHTLIAKVLQLGGVSVKPENISGVAKIAGLEEIGGIEYLDIRAAIEAEFPDNTILRFGIQEYFPVDSSIPIQATSMTMNLQLVSEGTGGLLEGRVEQDEMQWIRQILQTAGLDGQLLQEALSDKHKEIIELFKKAGADDPRFQDLLLRMNLEP